MTESQIAEARELHLLTTDSLLSDLVSGRTVSVAGGETLAMDCDDSRSVLDWYRRNSNKWAGNLTAGDAEAIVDVIGSSPPQYEASEVANSANESKKLRLSKLTTHRFAGLQAFGKTNEQPGTFTSIQRKTLLCSKALMDREKPQ